MAMTATIALSNSTTVTGRPVTAILTITNSGTPPVTVNSINPYVQPTSQSAYESNQGIALPSINFGPSSNSTVNGSNGTLIITWPIVFHGPSTMTATNQYLNTGTGTFDVGATIYSSDGSVFKPTVTTVTVNYAVTFPASQQ